MQTQQWKKVASMNQERYWLGGTVIHCTMNSFQMVIAGGSSSIAPRFESCELYNFTSDKWSALPDLKSYSPFRQLIAIDGKLIAGGAKYFEFLYYSTPEIIYKLVHCAVEFNLF